MKRKTFLEFAVMLAINSVEAAAPGVPRPSVERMANACAGCHGTSGHSLSPTPPIVGKQEDDFIAAMRDFKSGERTSSIMNRIARGYTDEDLVALARYFQNR